MRGANKSKKVTKIFETIFGIFLQKFEIFEIFQRDFLDFFRDCLDFFRDFLDLHCGSDKVFFDLFAPRSGGETELRVPYN